MAKTRPPYRPEFRRQIVDLVRAGRSPEGLAREFEPPAQSIRKAVLDRRCARRLHLRAGRDERMAPPEAEQKNRTKQESKTPSDQIP